MNHLQTLFMLIGYLVWPPYRMRLNREAGWGKVMHAGFYLLLREGCDRNDLQAARILSAKMKELCI